MQAVVSTHSRPKAAGITALRGVFYWRFQHTAARRRLCLSSIRWWLMRSFNTQPPEGGWAASHLPKAAKIAFQHTAARRRLTHQHRPFGMGKRFNTQPPEGGWDCRFQFAADRLFQHTAARRRLACYRGAILAAGVSTHSRPKAADKMHSLLRDRRVVSTHSRPKAAGHWVWRVSSSALFQHTAARRRLRVKPVHLSCLHGFNTQPPEGGWPSACAVRPNVPVSTHSRPKAAESGRQV